MPLTGPQRKLLHDAVLPVFKVSDLKQLVRFELDKDLDEITTDPNKSTVLFELIEWAEQYGRTPELIRAVQKARPRNEAIHSVASKLLPRPQPAETEARPPVPSPALTDGDNARWEQYRLSIRSRLEGLLEKLKRDEGQGSRILGRVAEALGIERVSKDEDLLSKKISTHLCESAAEQSIPRLMRLHAELCREGWDRPADLIADCAGHLFPLCFPIEVFASAWRQYGDDLFLITGTVATETGADVVLAGVDGEKPSFRSHVSGPRGEYLIPFEWPAPNDPSLEGEVLAVLRHLVEQAGVPSDEIIRGHSRHDVAVQTSLLSEALSGWLEWDKPRTGRTPYCALAMRESGERERREQVLKRVRELVRPLIFIELNLESPTRQREMSLTRTLKEQFELQGKRKTR
jgi:hypothetical protein